MVLSAGIIVARRSERGWLYLLLRAYNYWDFPKGEVEEGETPLEAAIRETREETGISQLFFSWGKDFRETGPYSGGRKKARYYLAETPESEVRFSVNPELGRPEHHEYRWLPGTGLKELAPARVHPVIDWARRLVEKSTTQ
jgi:bis(5'-nucleosidyl)-tetraphosphatase